MFYTRSAGMWYIPLQRRAEKSREVQRSARKGRDEKRREDNSRAEKREEQSIEDQTNMEKTEKTKQTHKYKTNINKNKKQ